MNKLEDHIKKVFAEREMTPSERAWEKIEKEVGKKGNGKLSSRKWYAIAASLIGLVVLSIYLFSSDRNEVIEIVDSPEKESFELIEIEQVDSEEITVNNKQVANSEAKETQKIVLKEIREAKIENSLDSLEDSGFAENNTGLNDQDRLINLKIQEVLATVDFIETNRNEVSDKEVDSLLRAAQKEILLANYMDRDSLKLDAMALLMEVEEELDESFRDQIFEKLKQGYFKVKTAVADRNK